jgi:hypothetical protein
LTLNSEHFASACSKLRSQGLLTLPAKRVRARGDASTATTPMHELAETLQ